MMKTLLRCSTVFLFCILVVAIIKNLPITTAKIFAEDQPSTHSDTDDAKKRAMADPLFQAILKELKLQTSDSPNAPSEVLKLPEPSVRPPSKFQLTTNDWLAVESLLKAARILEREAHLHSQASNTAQSNLRLELASSTRDLVTRMLRTQ